MQSVEIDGRTVKVGDYVCFKSDIEQSGQVESIRDGGIHGVQLTLTSAYGFHGHYIGGDERTMVAARDCWVE